jgi:hypothetical protein
MGTRQYRASGFPSLRLTSPFSMTWQCAAIHDACLQPVLKGWRPVTRNPPGTARAFAVAPGEFDTTLRGVSIQISRATARAMRAE